MRSALRLSFIGKMCAFVRRCAPPAANHESPMTTGHRRVYYVGLPQWMQQTLRLGLRFSGSTSSHSQIST